nr:hypothetical protein Iba_chr04fCG13170 [Ipomoea batatas]
MIEFSSSSFPFRRNEPLKRFPHRPLDFLHTLCRVLSILSHILIGALTSLLRVHIILRNLLKLPLLRLRLPLLQSLLGVHVPQPPPAHVPTGIEIVRLFLPRLSRRRSKQRSESTFPSPQPQ